MIVCNDVEQWDEDYIVTCCHRCGKEARCQFMPDPFLAEVYDDEDHPSEWWCYPCWSERHDEV